MSAGSLNSVGDLADILGVSSQRLAEATSLEIIHELRGIVAGQPLMALPEQLLSRGFVSHHLSRICMSLDWHPVITSALVALMALPWAGDQWIGAFVHLADRIESALNEENE